MEPPHGKRPSGRPEVYHVPTCLGIRKLNLFTPEAKRIEHHFNASDIFVDTTLHRFISIT